MVNNDDAIVVTVDVEREVPVVVEFVMPSDGNREELIPEVAAECNDAAMRKKQRWAAVDDDAPVVIVDVERDEAVVVASATIVVSDDDVLLVTVDAERGASVLVDDDGGAGCRLTHFRVISSLPSVFFG